MEQIFETYGQTILACISAAAIIGMMFLFLFGTGTEDGVLSEFMFKSLSSVL